MVMVVVVMVVVVMVVVVMVISMMVMWLMVIMGLDDWHNWRADDGWNNWFHVGGVMDRSLDDGGICMGRGQFVVVWLFADDASIVLLDVRVWRGDHFAVVRNSLAESVVNGLM